VGHVVGRHALPARHWFFGSLLDVNWQVPAQARCRIRESRPAWAGFLVEPAPLPARSGESPAQGVGRRRAPPRPSGSARPVLGRTGLGLMARARPFFPMPITPLCPSGNPGGNSKPFSPLDGRALAEWLAV
jgi:hypothetical protein